MTCSHLTLLPPIRAPPSPVDACDPGLKTLRYNGLHSAIPPHPHEFDFDATLGTGRTHWWGGELMIESQLRDLVHWRFWYR